MTILKSNLIVALEVAIQAQEEYEKEKLGYVLKSAMLAGWKDVLSALKNDEEVKISN